MIEIALLKVEMRKLKKHIKNIENAILKKNVKFSKEEIIRDFTLLTEFFELALDDNIKKVYAIVKDIEIIIDKYCLYEITESFKVFKQIVISEYKNIKN